MLDQIVKHGKVIRGWIGADYTDVPVAANGGMPARSAASSVTRVYPGKSGRAGRPAAGDMLLRSTARRSSTSIDLRNREAALAPGTKVHIDGTACATAAPFNARGRRWCSAAPSTTGAAPLRT